MKALRAVDRVEVCTSSGLLKDLTLQDAQTRFVSGKEARVPEPLHLPSEAATSRKGHKRRARTLGDSGETEQLWYLVGSDGEGSEARRKPLKVTGGHLEMCRSKARSRKNAGHACALRWQCPQRLASVVWPQEGPQTKGPETCDLGTW